MQIKDEPRHFSNAHGPDYRQTTWHPCNTQWHICIWMLPWRTWQKPHPVSNKCNIKQPEFGFCGAVCTCKDMKPDPIKVQALQDLPTSNSQTKLPSFLGFINYLQPFIPSLSTKTNFHREQLTEWDWSPSNDIAFQCLKSLICSTLLRTTVTYYVRKKHVIIPTSAIQYGLGAAFLQDGCLSFH